MTMFYDIFFLFSAVNGKKVVDSKKPCSYDRNCPGYKDGEFCGWQFKCTYGLSYRPGK